MAEAVLSGIAEGIAGQLGNAAVKQIAYLWGVEEELQKLEDTISTIKGVLIDAEKQQVHDEQIKTWLMRLEDAVCEADDLVDEFSTEALRRQVMTGNTLVKQVTCGNVKTRQQLMVLRIFEFEKAGADVGMHVWETRECKIEGQECSDDSK